MSRFMEWGELTTSLALISLIYIKCRIISFDFMEAGHGSLQWRLFFELWLLAACLEIAYFLS